MSASVLPDKLSALLRLAVSDAKKIEATPGYELNMSMWHEPQPGDVCSVCMAGAVMANTLGANPEDDLAPDNFEAEGDKLSAINCMRMGLFRAAYRNVCGPVEIPPAVHAASDLVDPHLTVANLDAWGRAPWEVYEQAAALLESEGL